MRKIRSHIQLGPELLGRFSVLPLVVRVTIICALVVGGMTCYLLLTAGLPVSFDLKSYQPKTTSVLYAEDESVLALFYRERRFLVKLDAIPEHVRNAFIAAEDARFFSHSGLDPWGMMRALVKNLQTASFAHGGSTITQQVARSILLTKEKTILRKVREIILARRIERTNTKAQILETYLNEIYLGRGAYGIEAAAQTYYGKKTKDLTVSEAAYLAGLAANPSKHAPEHAAQAEARRLYVLSAMLKLNHISAEQYNEASRERPAFTTNAPDYGTKEDYFAEAVRRYIISRYGERALYEEGLHVWTTLDLDLQAKAEKAVLRGVRAWERRHDRPAGLVKRLNSSEIEDMRRSAPEKDLKPGSSTQAVVVSGREITSRAKQSERLHQLTVMMKGGQIHKVIAESGLPYRRDDLLAFRVKEMAGGKPILEHDSLPPVQGALVAVENQTGYVRALIGGTGGDKTGFNRAIQALRQPGSSFKPVVYSAALEWGRYDPRTVIVDAPIVASAGSGNRVWIPENYDGSFEGPVTLKKALVNSRNIPAVKVMMDLGPDAISQMAHNMGIKSPIGDNLSSALGASEVSLLDLTSAYSVFPNMGVRVNPVLVKKITDRSGNVLEDNSVRALVVVERAKKDMKDGVCVAAPKSMKEEQDKTLPPGLVGSETKLACKVFEKDGPNMVRVMSPQTAYLMLSLLREVVVSGTASSASRMGRPDIGGKTGSTNDYTDAWFIGFNSKYTTGVWIGHDTRDSLGPKEFGARAALPVWMEYMSYALRNDRPTIWPPPPGIEFDGYRSLGRASLDKLLTSSPHFAPGKLLKRVNPVDLIEASFSADADAYSMWRGPATFGRSPYQGFMRVLSPRGKPIGVAAYGRDEKGNPVLQRIPLREFNQEGFGWR